MHAGGHTYQEVVVSLVTMQKETFIGGNYYHLFVSDCSLNHLKGGGEENLFLLPCLTDEWDIIPGNYSEDTCADPGIYVRGGGGGPGQSDQNSSDNVFFFFFFFFLFQSSAYFTEVKWSISKKSIIFQGSRGGLTFSGGGGGGVQLLIPYRNPYNL